MDILRRYLIRHDLNQTEFAAAIGVTQGAVSQWLIGLSKISLENALLIEGATLGEVSARELRPDLLDLLHTLKHDPVAATA